MAKEINVRIGVDEQSEWVDMPLTRAPHVLIGGTTGSGKSTLLHNLLTTLIVQHTPEDVRLFIGDPKRIEFHRYQDAPHVDYIARTVEEHVQMLDRLVLFMNTRYDLLQQCVDEDGVRVQGAYHKMVVQETDEGFRQFRFPNIVVVIDELGSLVLDKKHGKRIVEQLVLLTQLGRAAGITLILATQHPSAKTIDSRIKANCPTRIALKVSSKINSRIILDRGGAELLEHAGDALVVSPYAKKQSKIRCLKTEANSIDLQIQIARVKYARRKAKPIPQRKVDFAKGEKTVQMESSDCHVINFQHFKSLRCAGGMSPN